MPTYLVAASADLLGGDGKAKLAGAITGIHSDATGADGFFARVAFQAVPAQDCFLGAAPLLDPHCFIDARIRAGRSAEVRRELMDRIVAAASEILSIPRGAVWMYVTELPPGAMVEYGHALPEPGDEADWLARLPNAERAMIRPAKAR